MEVIDGNDGVLAVGIAVAATMQLFVCTPETSHVGPQSPHSSKNLSSRKCTPNDIPRRVGPREEIDPMSRLYVGLPPTKLLLRLIERRLAQQIFPVESKFPSQDLELLCK